RRRQRFSAARGAQSVRIPRSGAGIGAETVADVPLLHGVADQQQPSGNVQWLYGIEDHRTVPGGVRGGNYGTATITCTQRCRAGGCATGSYLFAERPPRAALTIAARQLSC